MWIVVDIGCIECGVDSNIVGIFSKKETADKVAECCSKQHSWDGGGQHAFEVFVHPEVDVLNDNYDDIRL